MRTLLAAALLLPLAGCCLFKPCLDPEAERRVTLTHVEGYLADFSKSVQAWYAGRGEEVPASFDEAELFRVLARTPADPAHVREVQAGYRVLARAVPGGFYTVVLCDRASDAKLLEDVSCTTQRVDVRVWDQPGKQPCEFEPLPERHCR